MTNDTMNGVRAAERDVAQFFGSLTSEEFDLRMGDAWTPAEHLQHLNTAVSAVARGLAMPRWLLRLRFGRARRPSRTLGQVRDDYRARLATGLGATGKYVPARENPAEGAVENRHAEILARWARVNGRLRAALESWDDHALDGIALPHPILGKITAREMVYFTIYHDRHHIVAAKSRLPRFRSTTTSETA